MKNDLANYALITGGSAGLGKEIAIRLAQRGYNLFIVALPDHHLEQTVETISARFPVKVLSLGIDLGDPEAPEKISQWVNRQHVPLKVLVNNVGMGYVSRFEEMDIEYVNKITQLNCLTMLNLTHHLVPLLRKSAPSRILNISSIASLFPTPYKSVYSASKYFVDAISYALREEFKEFGISVTCVQPPAMITNEQVRQRVETFGWLAKLGFVEPGRVAEKALKAMFDGKRKASPDLVTRGYLAFKRIAGYRIVTGILMKGMKREIAARQQDKIIGGPQKPLNIEKRETA